MRDDTDSSSHLDRDTVNGLVQLARDLAGTTDLPTMLELVVAAIADVAGFECAAINLVTENGDLQVVSVAGPPELDEALLGSIGSRSVWDAELTLGERHGAVLITYDSELGGDVPTWVSDDDSWFSRTADHPRAWRPDYAVYVPMTDPDGELIGVVSVDMPISGLVPEEAQLATLEILARQAETAIVSARTLARSALDEHIFGSVFETAGSPMCIASTSGALTQVNRRFRDRFGDIAHAADFDVLLSKVEGASGLVALLAEMFAGPVQERTIVVSVGHEDPRWFHVAVRGVAYSGADPVRAVCTMTDITSERRVREQFQHDAHHDALTGLLNRRGLHHAAGAFFAAEHPDGLVATLFCDLDDFKFANDQLGHRYGDEVLIDVAACLRSVAPVGSLLARVGGDEFVLVARCTDDATAEKLAAGVVGCVCVNLPGTDRSVTASVGMALEERPHSRGVGDLMHAADEALYRAKQAGKAGWVRA